MQSNGNQIILFCAGDKNEQIRVTGLDANKQWPRTKRFGIKKNDTFIVSKKLQP
jgi:hypothetical protein